MPILTLSNTYFQKYICTYIHMKIYISVCSRVPWKYKLLIVAAFVEVT